MRVNGAHGVRVKHILLVLAFVVGTISPAFSFEKVYANQITNRTLTLETGPSPNFDHGSMPGGVVDHHFTFSVPNVGSTSIAAVKFQYCTTASGSCTVPTGLDTTGGGVGFDDTGSGAVFTSLDKSTNGAPYVTRTAAAITPGSNLDITLTGVTNPTNTNEAFYVRISTHTDPAAADAPVDDGTVAASTATQIELSGTMPESLIFCTGETIATTAGIPDCSTATDGIITFNQLFSPTDTATATSQMAASTNAGTGYVISLTGPTLTSGSNTIPDMDAGGNSAPGTGQFGMNLVENTGVAPDPIGPTVGTAVTPAANGTNYKGQPSTGYDTNGVYKFDSVGINYVAASDNGGAGPSDSQIFTASYIVNVSGSQQAGGYNTTLTYVCTAKF